MRHRTAGGHTVVLGATRAAITCEEEADAICRKAAAARAVESTAMNAVSSRRQASWALGVGACSKSLPLHAPCACAGIALLPVPVPARLTLLAPLLLLPPFYACSHSVFMLYITGRNEASGTVLQGSLNLVDLAGRCVRVRACICDKQIVRMCGVCV